VVGINAGAARVGFRPASSIGNGCAKPRPVDVKQVGRELGVRYVLEGSVRKAADRVRITGQLIDAVTGAHVWAERASDNEQPLDPRSTRQYARLLSEWLGSIGLDPKLFGTHSLRRTKATLIYRRTGNLRAVQLLLGHTKIESTVTYLGIEVDDALAIAEQVDV
jgi:integrase